ncbi:MAG: TIGR04372 family glycosyltransferase, partial [Nanoarchaeota archaeon]|nr:TIGR04372 family glycosyltransferase [Nanoarchaeota archaeon]
LLSTLHLVEGIGWWNKSMFYELNNAEPTISFTEEEEKKGKELRATMGVNEKSFICFHARDASYLNAQWEKGDSYHNYRNCSIDNYLKAADYFTRQGGYALRMGSVVEKKISSKNHKIIDYATQHRSDFGDIYLPAKCKFFVGNTAGLFMVPTIFNVPVANANLVSIAYPPFRKKDLFIPSKIWGNKKKRFLTFKEIIDTHAMYFADGKEFAEAGLKIIENTPEEILDLVLEMNQRLDGAWKTTAEDEQLQAKYKALFPPDSPCYGFPSRIGTLFLRKNKELLD